MKNKKWLRIGGGCCVGIMAIAATIALQGRTDGNKVLPVATEKAVTATESQKITSVADKESTKRTKQGLTVHFQWNSKNGEFPHLYYTDVNGNKDTKMTSPGVPMNDDGDGWFSYTIAGADSAKVQVSVPEYGYQTTLQEKKGEDWWLAQGNWSKTNPVSEKESTDAKEVEVRKDTKEVAADSKITVHCYSKSGVPKVYYWNALPSDKEVDWPGEAMQEEANGWYSYSFDSTSKINVLFLIDNEQTDDFCANKAGDWYFDGSKWSQSNSTDTPTATPGTTDRPKPTRDPNAVVTNNDFREESIYFVMTARFFDGDSSNNIHCDHDAEVGNGDDDPAWRGDFKGLIEKLDYIKALGFSAIWITPVVENASGYDFHGYHAVNMKKVDPRLESSDTTYQTLIDEAHKRGMKIIQDIVLNHTGNSGEEGMFPIVDREYTLNKGASGNSVTTTPKSSAKGSLDEYMSKVSNGAYSDYNAALADTKNGPSWQYQSRDQWMKSADLVYRKNVDIGWEDFTVTTGQFAGDCMELNTEYPGVYNYLVDAYDGYINQGVDAFRIDTVKHISRLTMNTVFIPEFKKAAAANGNDNFYMFGEVACRVDEFVNHNNPCVSPLYYTWKADKTYNWNYSSTDGKDNLELCKQEYKDNYTDGVQRDGNYLQPTSQNALLDGNDYHTPDYTKSSGMVVIDYGMHYNFANANKAFGVAKQEDLFMNDSTWNVVYVDSHDYGPAVDGRDDEGHDKWRYDGGTEAWAENMDLMFTFRGIPCLYYGSEIEFKKGCKIDDYKNTLESSGRAYFGDNIEGTVNTTDFGVYSGATGAMATTLNSTLSKHLSKLNRIRRAVPALQKGQYSTEGCSGNIAYKRRYTENGQDSYALVAISGGCTFTGVLNGTYIDLVSGDKKTVSNGTLSTGDIGKANMRVYVLQNDTAEEYGATGKIGDSLTYLK